MKRAFSLIVSLLLCLSLGAGPAQQMLLGISAATPSGPTLIASDNFDSYADGVPLDTEPNWTFVVNTMTVYNPTGSAGSVYSAGAQGACYNNATFTSNQRSVCTVKAISAGSFQFVSVQVRIQAIVDTRYWFQTDGTNWYLVDRQAGAQNVIASGTQSIATDDKIRIDASGASTATRLSTAYFHSGVWTAISTNVDPGIGHYIDNGAPGIGGDGAVGSPNFPRGDDWEGWDL